MLSRLEQLHRFCLGQGLYPVVLSSGLAVGLLAGRFYLSREWTYHFLAWNLFLAWLPYLAGLWVTDLNRRRPDRWWYLLAPGLFWLAFFPNAPYIVTDLLHLRFRSEVPAWYDMGLLAAFAWAGLFLAVFSLRAMQAVVKRLAGVWVSWLFVAGAISLGGLGVYVGRFLRWNSWDLLLHPGPVLDDIFTHLTNPLHHPGTLGFTVIFAAFLLVCYLTIAGLGGPENPGEEAHGV